KGEKDTTKKGTATASGAFRQADGVAEGGQPLGMIAGEAVGVEVIKVVAAQLAIRRAVAEQMVGDHQDAVGHRDDGLLVAAALDQAAVLGGEVGVAFADGAPGALDQGRTGASPARGLPRSQSSSISVNWNDTFAVSPPSFHFANRMAT